MNECTNTRTRMLIYPAIDVRDGRVVRLHQGDYAQETRYALDPVAQAHAYREAGADWLHLVDLDAARAGGYTLCAQLSRIVAETGLSVQTGGGVRSADDVARLRDAGAARVVVGSLAVTDPATVCQWLQRDAEQITVALDTRFDGTAWRLPVHGWTEGGSADLFSTLAHYQHSGLRHVLCTDIARDGTLAGPNVLLYAQLRKRYPGLALQASGGVRNVADLAPLRQVGVAGVITGKALLDGCMKLAEALAC